MDAISEMEFDFVASGHYAKIVHASSDQPHEPSVLELSKIWYAFDAYIPFYELLDAFRWYLEVMLITALEVYCKPISSQSCQNTVNIDHWKSKYKTSLAVWDLTMSIKPTVKLPSTCNF